MNNEEKEIALHVAGATVRHQSSFANLTTPLHDAPITDDIRDNWVKPFYMKPLWEIARDFAALCKIATPENVLHLLGYFDWRPRTVGAHIIAIRLFPELQQPISNLLLKSEVCFAGRAYCLSLAAFGNEAAADTLCTYLDYYLHRPDLWFDQSEAMAALNYLDELLGSHRIEQFIEPWQQFVSNKPNWRFDKDSRRYRKEIAALDYIRLLTNNA